MKRCLMDIGDKKGIWQYETAMSHSYRLFLYLNLLCLAGKNIAEKYKNYTENNIT